MPWIDTVPPKQTGTAKKLYVYFYNPIKKRVDRKVTKFVNTPTGWRDAKKFLKVFTHRLTDDRYSAEVYQALSRIRFKDGFAKFIDTRNIAPKSIEAYKYAYDKLINYTNNIFVDEFTSDDYNKFIKHLHTQKINVNTIANVSRHLSVIFNYYKAKGWIKESVITKQKERPAYPRPIPPDDMEIILHQLKYNEQQYRLVMLLYLTGFRFSTLIRIKETDIDFVNGLIYYENIKGKKKAVFPIHNRLSEYLKTLKLLPGEKLVNYDAKKPPKFFSRLMKKLKMNYTFKEIRKTFASIMANSNISIFYVQAMLDHSDIKTTQKYYVATHYQNLRKEIDEKVTFAGSGPLKPITKPITKAKSEIRKANKKTL